MKDFKIWRSILKDPVRITTTIAGQVVDKKMENYADEDFENVEEHEKVLATLTMALSPDIAHGFREYTSTKALWESLIEVYEGNEDMRESCQDMVRQSFNMFNYVPGETLEAQLQRFTSLNTEMIVAGIFYTKSEINKKLLNSLPKSWDMNVAACQSFATQQAQVQCFPTPSTSSISAMPFFQNQSFVATQAASSSNVASFLKGKEDLPPQLSFPDLDQIHPEDVEEMDITWQIAVAVFRAKQFAKKIGKNNLGMSADKKVGFSKGKLRCFNCHKPRHFACDCPQPDRRLSNDRTIVAVGNNRSGGQVSDDAPTEIAAAEDQMMELQFALMVSSSHEPNKTE
ncbi:hypothetical protein Lser_V15G19898 [Lactuca serriola]